MFNCSFLKVETVHDVVDAFWLLLQGCGVGFMPIVGTLNGFLKPIPDIEVIPSTRTKKGGREGNKETWNEKTKVWTIQVGDSGEAWAKMIGKFLAGKYPAEKLVIDLSQIRPSGSRLAGYGYISSGADVLAYALPAIAAILNRRAAQLLTTLDMLDIMNWLGVIQTGRRGAEIALVSYGSNNWYEFATAKFNHYENNPQRAQSNNSLLFWSKPTYEQTEEVLQLVIESGGSEPGLINGSAALERAPWFSGVNPCAEILLANKSFCNLTEIDLASFKDNPNGLERAVYLTARANYRQTLVNLDDGILQRSWHENNEYFRLCGVGLTGIIRRPDLSSYDYRRLRNAATMGAYSMADDLGQPRPKNVTTIKPSGTVSKIMDTTEGCHKPLGRYLLNNINFNRHDPLLPLLQQTGYRVFPNPIEKDSMLVSFPVEWGDVHFDNVDGFEVNTESAIDQLERYRMLMRSYVDHNCSITVYYDESEIYDVTEWLQVNWDQYVGVAFMPRTDATKVPGEHTYLPQQVVSADDFKAYVEEIGEFELPNGNGGHFEIDDADCDTGVCPVR
jgi:ribonucleoside-triphosphate reductase